MRWIAAFLTSLLGFVGCITTVATPAPDIPATVAAAVAAALPTPIPTSTPDIEATLEARLQATIAAIPTPTPTPVPTPTLIPTPTLVPTPQPTATLIPTPTPSLASMVERVRPGVVRIDTNLGSGSGVIYESDAINRSALVLTNHHVVEDASWVDVEHPELGRSCIYPGAAAIYSKTLWRISRRAPLLGEHNQEVWCGELGLAPQELSLLGGWGVI